MAKSHAWNKKPRKKIEVRKVLDAKQLSLLYWFDRDDVQQSEFDWEQICPSEIHIATQTEKLTERFNQKNAENSLHFDEESVWN